MNSQKLIFSKNQYFDEHSSKEGGIMRRVSMGLTVLVLMAIMFLTTGVPTVQATVEEDWPAGTANTCRNSDDFFLNFETGIDEIEIESTIPSMEFTTTGSLNWKYGDIRTEKYNVYPYGHAGYETNGNFFAWLGTLGDQGRIDFLGGGASYASILVSTGSGLTLDAYDSDDTLIATSGWAGSNTSTRTFTRLTVEAPAGETIAYVMVHDTGNFWLMDDLCTDANKAVIPVPTRGIGSHTDRIDIIFVPDEDYGAPADIDTWLPNFIDDIQDQIDQRLDAAAPVTGNLDSFNFYYTRVQGDSVFPNHNLPADITRVAPWSDAYVILHTATFGDWTLWGPPVALSAEGAVGRSFIHEAGHGLFGLADEYDDAPACATARFEPNPNPNVWDAEADCRADVTGEGWGDPDDCWMFTTCTSDWWKFTTTRFIMDDGTQFANGWGQPSSRRIQAILDSNPGTAPAGEGPSGEAEKSIWLNMQVSAGVFSLLEESYVVADPPGNHHGDTFRIKVFSNGNAELENFGIHDPRIVQAEQGNEGPAWRDEANFQLVVPYFEYCGRVDLIDSATGNVELSVDISQYATIMAPVAVCKDIEVALDENGEATISAGDVDNGSYDPEGGVIELSLNKSDFTCADLGENSVTLTVIDEEGAPAACTAVVTVIDNIPPEIQCNAPVTITPPDAPVSFSATATDNCAGNPSVGITGYDCFKFTKKGKRIDKTESCIVEVSGNTVNIANSGGVNDNIPWTVRANDNSGNVAESMCSVLVVNPHQP
ncbi:MAG: M64 family metallopeptidase [Deltaproteobacteria bacterium]|nr:M64 family metallopeptidase [Deltaproteobacteria bacterium]